MLTLRGATTATGGVAASSRITGGRLATLTETNLLAGSRTTTLEATAAAARVVGGSTRLQVVAMAELLMVATTGGRPMTVSIPVRIHGLRTSTVRGRLTLVLRARSAHTAAATAALREVAATAVAAMEAVAAVAIAVVAVVAAAATPMVAAVAAIVANQ